MVHGIEKCQTECDRREKRGRIIKFSSTILAATREEMERWTTNATEQKILFNSWTWGRPLETTQILSSTANGMWQISTMWKDLDWVKNREARFAASYERSCDLMTGTYLRRGWRNCGYPISVRHNQGVQRICYTLRVSQTR